MAATYRRRPSIRGMLSRQAQVFRAAAVLDYVALAVYTGPFGPEQAERLLWRAGFGPRGGEDVALARKGLRGAVNSLVQPHGVDRLVGKPPLVDGHPIAPKDAFGHDHLW